MDQAIIEKMAREQRNSPFESYLRTLPVSVTSVFLDGKQIVPASFKETGETLVTPDADQIATLFPGTIKSHSNKVLETVKGGVAPVTGKKVLVLFSGGPAAGGNNVLVGLYKALCPANKLFGVKAGPGGLLKGQTFEITEEGAKSILNMGGFDFLGSDRTKIETDEQFEMVKKVCQEQAVDAIVVVGGDDSNTNAGFLAEKLYSGIHADGRGVQVIGVPKTIDGDLQIGHLLPISFGFDTATKIYAEMVGNIAQDTPSSRKYYHFIKIMGRSASHVGLAVAQLVRPTITLVSEEVEARGMSLDQIATGIAQTIAHRAAKGIAHGVVIIPEGLIEFIPECKSLIAELNPALENLKDKLAGATIEQKKTIIRDSLTEASKKTLDSLPEAFRTMLLLDRDSHGNLPVSQIETEKLLIEMVDAKVKAMHQNPAAFDCFTRFNEQEMAGFKKYKFAALAHFLGYEGRCGAPTKFDMAFCLNLGLTAGSLILAGKTGYMASVTDLDKGGKALAIPLTGLLNIEQRGAKKKVVIKKALVELDKPAFQAQKKYRKYWAAADYFQSVGPRQYNGPKDVTDNGPITAMLNQGYSTLTFNLGEDIQVF
jgi:pyrophosphate--fructose-6-phosphate 1-phosphotransferase